MIRPSDETTDPRIASVQEHLAREREVGRWIFSLSDSEVARILVAADAVDPFRDGRAVLAYSGCPSARRLKPEDLS